MYVVEGRNVNTVYAELIRLIRREGSLQTSRAGEVLVLPAPVMLATHRPQERVLLDERRDANPFFHLFESLFLLAGREDYTWLDRFVRDFSARFAEPDGRGHGSYGFRWRNHFGYDQLDTIVEKLRGDPYDRRVVLTMWDGTHLERTSSDEDGFERDWYEGADDLRADKRDIPCNTHIYPRIVGGVLDLTVCCRSNDAVWGAAGANAVQFSMLQEYLAGRIGVEVGKLYQLANNMHLYTARAGRYGDPAHRPYRPDPYDDPEPMRPVPIMTDPEAWDEDLQYFMVWVDKPHFTWPAYKNNWFRTVGHQMWHVHELFHAGPKQAALEQCKAIEAPDWRRAAEAWIQRRMK